MGNCQAAEAATVIVEHPGGKVERIYWSVSASEVMVSNPGHYVALITLSVSPKGESGAVPQKQLKLLRPDDTLHIGHNYRLVSFEEVLMEFSGKNCVKLNKLLSFQKPRGGNSDQKAQLPSVPREGRDPQEISPRVIGATRSMGRQAQWRPALQSISEVGR